MADPTPTPEPAPEAQTDAQLEAMLNAMRDERPPAPEGMPVDLPVEEPSPVEPEPEAVEAAPEPEPEPEKAAEPPPPSSEEILEDIRLSLQEESLRREKLEAQLAHERLLREQSNTRVGSYKKLTTDLLREGRMPPAEDPDYSDDTPVNGELRSIQQELAELRNEANTRASQETLQGFINSTSDLSADTEEARKLLQEMQPHVQAQRREHAELLDSGNPRLVRETTKLILKSAYVEAKAARLVAERSAAKERRASQFAALGEAKSKATISGTGTAAPARPKPKMPSEMTAEEADAALRAMTR